MLFGGAILLQPDPAEAGAAGTADEVPAAAGEVADAGGGALEAASGKAVVAGNDAVAAGAALAADAGTGAEATVTIWGFSQLPLTR